MGQTASDLLILFSRYYFALLLVVLLVGLAQRALRDLRRGEQVPVVAGHLLVLSPGEGKTVLKPGQRFVLGADCTIGRDTRCDIRLNDDSVRNNHAQIYQQARHLMLADVGGDWGTFLNGEQVEQRVELYHGDVLQLGRVLMRVLRTDRMLRPQPEEDEEDEDLQEELDEQTCTLQPEKAMPAAGLTYESKQALEADTDQDEYLPQEDGEDEAQYVDDETQYEDEAAQAADQPDQDEDEDEMQPDLEEAVQDEQTDDDEADEDDLSDQEHDRLLQELEMMRRRQSELEQALLQRKRRASSKGNRQGDQL